MGNVLPANLHMQIRSGSCINKSIQPNEFLGWILNMANCKLPLWKKTACAVLLMEVSNHDLKAGAVIQWTGVLPPQNPFSSKHFEYSLNVHQQVQCEASWFFPITFWPEQSHQLSHNVAASVNICGTFSRCLFIITHFAALPSLSFSTCTPLDGCRQCGAVIRILSFFCLQFTNLNTHSIQNLS